MALAESANAEQILPDLDKDTRVGYGSEEEGVSRGGLFDSDLVRWKIGELENLLLVQLPAMPAELSA